MRPSEGLVVDRRAFIGTLTGGLLAAPLAVGAQQTRLYRIGVILEGGPYAQAVEGLREGLQELGLEEGKQLSLSVYDTKGRPKAVEIAAREFEGQGVDLIYTVTTSVTVATTRATKTVPIVFYCGSDPVAQGLAKSYRKPGGRLTGIHTQLTTLTAKRLEILKEILPKAHRIIAFYDPENPAAQQSVMFARAAARQLKIELVERQVASVEVLATGLRKLRPGEVDALLYVSDAMVASQQATIIEIAREKRLPTIFQEPESVVHGALASYGVSLRLAGRLSAKIVQRILLGANPGDLPIEQLNTLNFALNLKTAKALGLTIPPSLLQRADQVIE
jgi:putative ABC transport system substrate-binding protein